MSPENLKQTLRQMANEADELRDIAGAASLTDVVAGWLVPHYVAAAREQLETRTGHDERWKILRLMANDLSALRRGDHCAERLRLLREQLDLERSKTEAAKEKEFHAWLQRPDIRAELFPECNGGLKRETLEKIERELRLL